MMGRKVPVFLQQQRTDCGLVSLAMIASYFDSEQTPDSLRALAGLSCQGADLHMLMNLAGKEDLIARPVRLDIGDMRQLRLPAILHWSMDQFVVLVRDRRDGVVINEPAMSQRCVALRELNECFTGVALEIIPGPNFGCQKTNKAVGLSDFLVSFRFLGRFLSSMLILLLAIQILSLVPAVVTQLLIDEVVLGQDRAWLIRALAGVCAIMVIVVVLEALRQWITLYSGTRLAFDSGSMVVRHLFQLPASFFHARHPGDVLSKLDSLNPIRQALMQHGVNAVVHSAVIATTLGLMFFYSLLLTTVTVTGLVLAAILRAALLPANRRLNEHSLVYGVRQNSSLLATLSAFDSVRLQGLTTIRLADWQRHFSAATNARTRRGQLSIWSNAGTSLISVFEQVSFLGIGISGIAEKQITLGVLFAFMSLRGRLLAAATQLSVVLQDLFMLKTHTSRLSDIVLTPPAYQSHRHGICKPIRGHLSVKDLNFRYAEGAAILSKFACDIDAGEHIAITGPSGCGKSTLLGLISGRLAATSGSIRIDGIETDLWGNDTLCAAMTTILQDDALFPGSIAENICGFSGAPDMEEIRLAANRAAIWPEIRAMPMMHNTQIGDMQGGLSGGQRQQIILARAFYRRPKILLMDEATSHLDRVTEQRVLDGIDSMGATTISVTHGPDAIRRASRVIQLDRSERLP